MLKLHLELIFYSIHLCAVFSALECPFVSYSPQAFIVS